MSFEQQAFNFSDITAIELTDENGQKFPFNRYTSPVPAIASFLKCSNKKAVEVLEQLEKDFEVYACKDNEIAIAEGENIKLHFLYGGGIWWKGEWIQKLTEWDFVKFIAGQKVKTYKAPKPKKITITATERQIKKAKQLFYAKNIGFEITGKDYQKWHLL